PMKPNQLFAVFNPETEPNISCAFDFQQRSRGFASLGVESAPPIPMKPNQLFAVFNPETEPNISCAFDFQQRSRGFASLGVVSATPIPKKPNQLFAVSNPETEPNISCAFDFQQRVSEKEYIETFLPAWFTSSSALYHPIISTWHGRIMG
ncbi:MAG: hypothetical protein M0Q99_11215, partial [Candidatus Cloacimonetes bacterium]|nr:hypothetical protein [Candidatus Cloacimonadota bacterium]